MNKIAKILSASVVMMLMMLLPSAVTYAGLSDTFNQTINPGTLTASINQAGDTTPVASPTVAFSAVNYSFQCQTATGTLGDTNNLINVTNLASGINTWNLALAATSGTTATWTNGTNTYAYNNVAGSPAGCTSGDMTVNPSVATKTDDCNGACTANASTVSLGTSAPFNGTTTPAVTIISDSAGTPWEGYVTGVSLSQTIPQLTPSGSYTLPMTLTLSHT